MSKFYPLSRSIIRSLAAAVLVGVPAAALATTPVPVLVGPTPANGTPLGQGIMVQSMPDEWGGPSVITYNYKGTAPGIGSGLISETGDPLTLRLLSPWPAEAMASDVQGDFTAFIEYTGAGGSELYAKTLGGTTVLNPSAQSSVYEDFPAVYTSGTTRHLVWQTGSFSNWEIKFMGPVSPTGTTKSFGAGKRPAISQSIAAWESAGDIKYTLNRTAATPTFSTVGSTDEERLPAVGGNRIFYERISASGTSTVAFRETNNPSVVYAVTSPCTQQFKPRVSGNGHYLLYTGTGCPAADGQQPLYLVNINSSRVQTTYLVADLGQAWLDHDMIAPYDVDGDGIAYQYYDGSAYTAYWAQLDTSQLP